jgi:hypothetical protein
MSLTSENLIGYMRAEFAKSAKMRVARFVVQMLAAVPAAVSVVIPDDCKVTLYVLAIAAVVLLIVWWILNQIYVSARSAAQAARRGALLLGGLNSSLSPSEIDSLRDRFTVSPEVARKYEKADYYATNEPHGSARLAEMIEESALYSEHLQRKSARVMLYILLTFAIVVLGVSLVGIPVFDGDTGLLIARVILAIMVFVLSADAIGAFLQHRAAAEEIKQIRNRLKVASRDGYPMPDVLLAFADYNSAVEGCPESVPFVYGLYRKELDQRWLKYQEDRAAAREAQQGTKP